MTAQPQTVVIVDDDADVRRALSRDFRHLGYHPVAVATGDEAIAAVADSRPVGVVVDLYVNGYADGVQLVGRILRVDRSLPVVVLTGKGSIATAIDAMKLGAIDYLEKPVRAAQLVEAFQDVGPSVVVGVEPEAPPLLAQVEWEHIHRVLSYCSYNASLAARLLGVDRSTLRRRLRMPPDKA